MLRGALRCVQVAAVAALVSTLTFAAPAPPDKGGAGTAEKVRRELDRTVSVDLDMQPLHLAVAQLHEQTRVTFVLDRFALQQVSVDPDQATVTLKLKEVKLKTALRSLLTPLNLTYAVVGETVVISSEDMAPVRQLRQRINVDLNKTEFGKALHQMAHDTGTNLVLDTRVVKEAQAPVTLQMEDVQLETAVRLLSVMAGLKTVRVGNVLFVTSKPTADEIRQDPDLAPMPNPGNPMEKTAALPALPPPAAPAAPATKPAADDDEKAKKKTDEKDKPDEKTPEKAPEKPADKAPEKAPEKP